MSITLTTIALLLVTTTLLARACPIGSGTDCQDICQPYREARDSRNTTLLIVGVIRSELKNDYTDIINSNNGGSLEFLKRTDRDVVSCDSDTPNPTAGCAHSFSVSRYANGDVYSDLKTPWSYACDYNQNRIPQYLWKAECDDQSVTVHYRVPVLKRESCNTQSPWQLVIERVPVACASKNLTTSSQN